jgi:predicted ATPase
MRLTNFQVRNYKVIHDSTRVIVDPRVTALVGKNESGKSAILQALWKSRNVTGTQFDALYDYPRGIISEDAEQRQETSTEFELSPEESADLSNELPHAFERAPTTLLHRVSYNPDTGSTNRTIEFDQDLKSYSGKDAIQAVNDTLAGIEQNYELEDSDTPREAVQEAISTIDEDAPLSTPAIVAAIEGFSNAASEWLDIDPDGADPSHPETARIEHLLSEAKKGNPQRMAQKWADRNLPTFIYFDDYSKLDSRIHLPTYLEEDESVDPKRRTQAALFARSGIDPQQIFHLGRPKPASESEDSYHRRIEERSHILEKASVRLTGEWIEWWTEREHSLHFEADGDNIVLKVSDEHNTSPVPFEHRSHGFQWLFSFYIVFLAESETSHRDAILLLDEPGLHLHPTLQSKLLDLFELMAESNQLIYTTHLPFLIDGDHLERVRIVYLTGPEPQTARVSSKLRPEGDFDTLLPIQAALGYSIAQTLFIGKRSLIVEGIVDYWLIKALNDCLAAQREDTRLHGDTVLIPAGGTSQLMPLASIMFSSTGVGGRRLLVLLDSDKDGRAAAKKMEKTFGKASQVIMTGTGIGVCNATIEDLFPLDYYADALRKAGYEFELDEEDYAATTNVQAIRPAFQRAGHSKFGVDERAAAALKIIDNFGEDPSCVPEVTKERAIALLSYINEGFEEMNTS